MLKRGEVVEAEILEVVPDTATGLGIRSGYCIVVYEHQQYRMTNGTVGAVPKRSQNVGSKILITLGHNDRIKFVG